MTVPVKLKEEMVDRLKESAAAQGLPFERLLTDIVDTYFMREEALAKGSYRAQESMDAVYVLGVCASNCCLLCCLLSLSNS